MKRDKRGRFAKKQPRDSYGRFSDKDGPPTVKRLPPTRKGRFVRQPPNYVWLNDFDLAEDGLVCRLAENGRILCNVPLILIRHSDLKKQPAQKSLFLDMALNILDRFFPVGEDRRKPVKLKRGQASRDAVKLHKDFADFFLLAPGWEKEMTMEDGKPVEYQRFDLSLRRMESWITEALFLLTLKKLT